LLDALGARAEIREAEDGVVVAEEGVVRGLLAVGEADVEGVFVVDDEIGGDGPREGADVLVEEPLGVWIRHGETVVGQREGIAVGAAVSGVPIAARVLRAGLVEAIDPDALAAKTPINTPARSDVPLVAEEIGKLQARVNWMEKCLKKGLYVNGRYANC
jgi:hypothetical protein